MIKNPNDMVGKLLARLAMLEAKEKALIELLEEKGIINPKEYKDKCLEISHSHLKDFMKDVYEMSEEEIEGVNKEKDNTAQAFDRNSLDM